MNELNSKVEYKVASAVSRCSERLTRKLQFQSSIFFNRIKILENGFEKKKEGKIVSAFHL